MTRSRPLAYNGLDLVGGSAENTSPLTEGAIACITHIALNVMSLLLVGVGLAVTATFFLGSPFPDQEARAAAVDAREPDVPAITPKKPVAVDEQDKPKVKRVAVNVPEDKTLRISVPKMSRVRNAPIPYASGTDENAFRNNAGVHLRGTGFPWNKTANVYVAGHRLGYPNTESFLVFWDLNKLKRATRWC
jgi:sortase A